MPAWIGHDRTSGCRTHARWAFWRTALAVAAVSAAGAAAAPPHVLLLNSYGADVRWAVEITGGVREFLAERLPQATLVVETLQGEGQGAPDAAEAMAERLQQRHRRRAFDVVIAADDAAYQFVLQSQSGFLPGVPVVFCGVSGFSPRDIEGNPRITGVLQVSDLRRPLTTALLRQPSFRHLVVIHDQTPAGLEYRRQVEALQEDLGRVRPNLSAVFLSAADLTTHEMVDTVRRLKPNCLVLFTTWHAGRDGEPVARNDLLPHLARNAPVPVYSVTELSVAYETSRDRIVQAYRHGYTAAAIAYRILRGIPPAEIPVVVLQQDAWGEGASLPGEIASPNAGALRQPQVGTRPRSWFSLPDWVLWAIGGVWLLQLGAIAGLIVANARSRALQRDLEACRYRLELVLDHAGLGFFEWDVASGRTTTNQHCAELLGMPVEELPATIHQWQDLIHADDREAVLQVLHDCLDDARGDFAVQCRLGSPRDGYRRLLIRAETVERDAAQAPVRLVGILAPGQAERSDAGTGSPGSSCVARHTG